MRRLQLQDLIRRAFCQAVQQAPAGSVRMLDRIVMIGGKVASFDQFAAGSNLPPSAGQGCLYASYPDAVSLYDVARVLPHYGYALSPDAEIRVCNISDNPQEDALRLSFKADAVFYSYIYDRYSDDDEYDAKTGIIRDKNNNPDRTRSMLALDSDIWFQTLMQSGARVAVNVQGFTPHIKNIFELSTSVLERAPFIMAAEIKNYAMERVSDILIGDHEPGCRTGSHKVKKLPEA